MFGLSLKSVLFYAASNTVAAFSSFATIKILYTPKKRRKTLLYLLMLILLIIILAPILPYILQFVVWLISLPIKGIAALCKTIKRRRAEKRVRKEFMDSWKDESE